MTYLVAVFNSSKISATVKTYNSQQNVHILYVRIMKIKFSYIVCIMKIKCKFSAETINARTIKIRKKK